MRQFNFKPVFIITALFFSMCLGACEKENNNTEKNDDNRVEDTKVPLSGHYVWKFEIPGIGEQESHLTFYTDSVQYIMIGPAYTTNYMMIQESYSENTNEKRWIGVGKGGSIPKNGVYFVMFFKDITENSVKIYKRECIGGKEEAESFAYPEADVSTDHGWNEYRK